MVWCRKSIHDIWDSVSDISPKQKKRSLAREEEEEEELVLVQ